MQNIYLEITLIALGFILSILGTLVVVVFKQMKHEISINMRDMQSEIKELGKSIRSVNNELIKVVENVNWHKEELNNVDNRLQKLEGKK